MSDDTALPEDIEQDADQAHARARAMARELVSEMHSAHALASALAIVGYVTYVVCEHPHKTIDGMAPVLHQMVKQLEENRDPRRSQN